ncbi:MAG: FkbM family methyltransferase [Pleurocapsa sp.]
MILSSVSTLAKQILIPLGRLLPVKVVEQLGRMSEQNKLALRLSQLGAVNRDVTMSLGVGAGLKFNSGQAHPDLALGRYELALQQTFGEYLKPGDIFYDIGANVGFFTIIGAKLVGEAGTVYAFEPLPNNAANIRHNIQLNGFNTVTVIEKAVSEKTAPGKLLVTENVGGNTLSGADSPPDVTGAIAVELIAIDDLISQGQIKPPNLIKVDVEGAELDALKGMEQTLRQYRPIVIYEIDDGKQDNFDRKQQAVADFLISLNYRIEALEDSYPDGSWLVGHWLALPN